jgi:hypothetical protein
VESESKFLWKFFSSAASGTRNIGLGADAKKKDSSLQREKFAPLRVAAKPAGPCSPDVFK